jgi:hypothetical protein
MTIKQLLDMPIGDKVGGFMLVVKHAKKMSPQGSGWSQEVTLTDSTGDMLADVWRDKYTKLVRNEELWITVCEVQSADTVTGKKLLVHEGHVVTASEPPINNQYAQKPPNWDAISRGKVKHGLTCAYIQANTPINKELIEELADWIVDNE